MANLGNSESWILRADPAEDGSLKQPVEETSIRRVAKSYLKTEDLYYTLAAYNNMLPASMGSQACHLIGFEIYLGRAAAPMGGLDSGQAKNAAGYWAGGGIAVRAGPDDYYMVEVGGRGSKTSRPLTAVRCFEHSPFPSEAGAIYFGGYDCNSNPSDNTAWIYKSKPA